MKKFYSRLAGKQLLLVLVGLVCAGSVWAQTYIPAETISVDSTWTKIKSPYILQGTVTVNGTLTIEPGVTVQFPAPYIGSSDPYSGVTLQINGKLIAQGNVDSIIFQGDGNTIDNGSYDRHISGPVIVRGGGNAILQYVKVDALGFGTDFRNDNTAAIDVNIGGNLSITNCKIQNIRGTGVFFEGYTSKRIAFNTFASNTVGIKFENYTRLVDSNHFAGNINLDVITSLDNLDSLKNNNYDSDSSLKAGVGLIPGVPVNRNDIMRNITSRYVLLDTITIPFGKILTMNAGILFQFPAPYIGSSNPNSGRTFTIGGTLIAKGTVDNYITLQGDGETIDNGSYDRHNSGPVIFSKSSTNNILQYVKVDAFGFGTDFRNDSTGAFNINSSSCNILNCIFQNIRGEALTVRDASPYIAGSCFYKNRGGVFSRGSSFQILHSNFEGNTSFGVKNISINDTINAADCWWNNPFGPTNPTTNPIGGDVVSDYVLYNPWSTDPFECSDPTILPLTLLNFQTTLSNNTVNCTWQTATETNTSYFIIQRSTNGANFTSLGKVYASGNSTISKSYSFTDKSPNNGINYYRLQMVDKDGKYSYSKTVPINISIKQPFAIYPNPVKDVLYVQVQKSASEKVSLQIIDMQGKTIVQQNRQLEAGVTTLSVNTTALSKGSYFIVIKGQATEKKLFIKE